MRLSCVLVALLLTLAPRGAGGAGVLQQAAKASGEPWRHHVRSRVAESENVRLIQTQIDEQGTLVVTRRCSGVLCSGTIVDAGAQRQSFFSYNDTPIPQTAALDPVYVTLRAIASYEFTSDEFAARGGRVTVKSENRIGERTVIPVSVTAPGGATLDALLDPQTWLVSAVARERQILYRYEDERPAGTLVLPMRIIRPDRSVERFEERGIVAEPLATPSGPQAVWNPQATAAKLEDGALPRFPCRVENLGAVCVLDTGASGLAVSLDLVDRLHKSLIGRIALEGVGRLESGIVRIDSLDLGTLRLGAALYAILPDTGGFKSDVVIGSDVIAKGVVRIDFPHRTIRFDPQGASGDGSLVKLTFAGFTPSLPIRLQATEYQLALDTGDAASIDFSEAFSAAHPGLFTASGKRTVLGVGGRGTQSIGKISDVEFAGFVLHDVPAGTTDIPGSPAPARVGAAFLSRFTISMDYTNSRMSVRLVR